MRKLFLSSLILLMFASTMVCGCWHEAQAAAPASQHSDGGHSHGNDTTVLPDCTGTDMQLPQQISVSKPDLKHSFHLDYVWTDEKSAFVHVLASSRDIRGPPSDWPSLSQTHPSILLTTQRFLI